MALTILRKGTKLVRAENRASSSQGWSGTASYSIRHTVYEDLPMLTPTSYIYRIFHRGTVTLSCVKCPYPRSSLPASHDS